MARGSRSRKKRRKRNKGGKRRRAGDPQFPGATRASRRAFKRVGY